MRKKTVIAVAIGLGLGVAGLLYLRSDTRRVAGLVARNVAARGGAEAWRAVSSMRLTGQMGVGQGMLVPYVLDQKRPGKMCLEFVFQGEKAAQCSDGTTGWKVAPFRGLKAPAPLDQEELRQAADAALIGGLLIDHAERGHDVELVGRETIQGRDTWKLQVTLPKGSVRWVYLDAETALEVKVEALRTLRGRERRVETFFHDWQPTQGLLIARRQETRTEGEKAAHPLTVESVRINPASDDARFAMPTATARR